MEKNSKRYNKIIAYGILWALALSVVLMVVYGIPEIGGTLKSTYVAEYDRVYVSNETQCYLVKDELITYANAAGTAAYYVEQGTHIRKYTEVMSVGSASYTSDKAGILSYTADGYETFFIKDNFQNITKETVGEFTIENQKLAKETIASGEPIFKVVDDKEWYIVFWIDKEEMDKYTKGNSVSVLIDDNHRVNAEIYDIYEQKDGYLVVLESGEYYDKLAETRTINAEVVLVDQQGLLIKQKSIVTVDGQPGVFVKQLNGKYEFVRVKILTLADDDAIVAAGSFSEMSGEVMERVETINAYDEILKNPKSVDKGGEKSE